MSYLPSPFTGYFSRVDNTVVSGNQLLSYLTGGAIRQLEFDAAVHSPPALVTSGTPGTAPTVPQWMQASIGSLPVQCSTGATGFIYVGPDATSTAASWCAFFNLQSTNDVRVLRFHVESEVAGSTGITNGGTTLASVITQTNGNSAQSQGGSTNLFITSSTAGQQLSGVPGAERIVLVSANSVTSGSEVVVFNVLSNSL